MKKNYDEYRLWKNLDKRHKSYLVQVLHYYHYRRNRLHSGWKREETLTWELIRALEILPRDYFLKNILKLLRKKSQEENNLFEALINNLSEVKILAYPSLKLSGNQKNSKSDIGLEIEKTARIWIEAKTVKIDKKVFDAQNRKQEKALGNMKDITNWFFITLIPYFQETDYPKLYWMEIKEIFEEGRDEMKNNFDEDQWEGYDKIALEFIDRIVAMNI